MLAYVACTFLWMQRVCGCSLFTLLSLRCSRCWLIMRRLSAGESRLCCFVAESFAVYIVTAPVTTTFRGEEPNRVTGVSQSRPLGPRARVFEFRCSHFRLHTAGFHLQILVSRSWYLSENRSVQPLCDTDCTACFEQISWLIDFVKLNKNFFGRPLKRCLLGG